MHDKLDIIFQDTNYVRPLILEIGSSDLQRKDLDISLQNF